MGQSDDQRSGYEAAIRMAEAEIRRVQRRNTATNVGGTPHTWNDAVKTMADECIDAIKTSPCG